MEILALLTAFIITGAFIGAFLTKYDVELIFGIAFVILLLIGALPVEYAFSGLSNPGVITLVCLFVIAGALRVTGGINVLLGKLLDPRSSTNHLQIRLLPPVAALSAFFNNTPIVAALTPGIVDWCKRHGLSPTKILLPISYAAILGGTCTLIGTSTNLIINGLLATEYTNTELGFFEISKIGIPITVIGVLYLIIFSGAILPKREIADKAFVDAREYTYEMLVEHQSDLIGKTIEQAGLRGLKSAFLIELIRQETKIGNVRPDLILKGGDRLVFSGGVQSLNDLAMISGLRHADDQVYKLEETVNTRILEVIVTASNSQVGHTIKESNFRKRHQSVVIAVIRNGERLNKKTGDIKINAGDMLLLHASNGFAVRHEHSNDFLILQGGSDLAALRSSKAIYAWLSLGMVILLAAFNVIDIVIAAFLGVILCLVAGCINTKEAQRSIDFKVLALIVFAFGFGEAIEFSGLAENFSQSFFKLQGYGPFAILVGVYLLTLVLTELVTNNAAAVIVFALVSGIVVSMELNIIPYAIAIMIAASASFITPLGYQTNLLVYSAGNYRFSDYFKLGLPLSIMVAAVTLYLIPLFWPLSL